MNYDLRTARCEIQDKYAFLRDLREIAGQNNIHIICLNVDLTAGKVHAQSAVSHAIRSFQEGVTISRTVEMESLLFAAGSRQCSVASEFGIRVGVNHLYVCCYPGAGKEVWESLARLFQFTNESDDVIGDEKRVRLMKIFGITSQEMEAVGDRDCIVDLVQERIALLNVLR